MVSYSHQDSYFEVNLLIAPATKRQELFLLIKIILPHSVGSKLSPSHRFIYAILSPLKIIYSAANLETIFLSRRINPRTVIDPKCIQIRLSRKVRNGVACEVSRARQEGGASSVSCLAGWPKLRDPTPAAVPIVVMLEQCKYD